MGLPSLHKRTPYAPHPRFSHKGQAAEYRKAILDGLYQAKILSSVISDMQTTSTLQLGCGYERINLADNMSRATQQV